MLAEESITVIGAGNIGRALIGGLLRSDNHVDPGQIWATRRDPEALHELEEVFPGIRAGTDNRRAVRGADVVLICVKPQNASEVFEDVRETLAPNALVISVLAGITTDSICDRLGEDVAAVRAMPNTPALVDEGATAIAGGRYSTDEQVEIAAEIFRAVGIVEIVPEYQMDAVTGLSGSGPAYVYMVIEALTDGGVKQGLTRKTALRLAAQTVFGAAKLVLETGKHPAILRDEVTTPGGTAIAAVAELEDHGLRTMLIDAVKTATRRSRRLSDPSGQEDE